MSPKVRLQRRKISSVHLEQMTRLKSVSRWVLRAAASLTLISISIRCCVTGMLSFNNILWGFLFFVFFWSERLLCNNLICTTSLLIIQDMDSFYIYLFGCVGSSLHHGLSCSVAWGIFVPPSGNDSASPALQGGLLTVEVGPPWKSQDMDIFGKSLQKSDHLLNCPFLVHLYISLV